MPILRLIRPLAVLAVLALIFGRALGPSWAGIAVGMDDVIRGMEITGGTVTQLFAMAATVVAMAEIIAVTRAPLPHRFKIGAVGIGGFVIIVNLSASAVRAPAFSMGIIGGGAALLALAAAWDARRSPFARPAALVLGLVGIASALRLASVAAAYAAADRASLRLVDVARGVATGSFLVEAFAVFVALAVIASGGRKLTNPLTTIALILAFIVTRQALVGATDDAGTVSLLLRRATDRLITRPEPFVPVVMRVFVSVLSVLVAGAALVARGHVPALIGAVALLLVARGSPDAPLGALTLVIASLGVALAARDDRGVWAAIAAEQKAMDAPPAKSGP